MLQSTSLMSKALKIYKGLPAGVKRFAKSCYSLIPLKARLGKDFFSQLEFLEKSQWWSKQELENYQNEELKKLIKHSYENVPYYKRIFNELKLTPSDIKTVEDLPKLPILTKEIVRNNTADLIAQNYNPESLIHDTTSGTTGKITEIYLDPKIEFINGGPFEWRFYRWGGYNPDDLCAVFRSGLLRQNSLEKERIFEFNPVQKKVFFSIYDLNSKNIGQYVTGLQKYPVKFLQGFPTILKKLVDILKEKNIPRPFTPKAVFTVAELLSSEQRLEIESYFGAKIFDWYGMKERTVAACECEKHNNHHINPEFGIVEFAKDEIIATGLTNYAMPFIRYKTGDCAEPVEGKCSCGREFPLIKIIGGRTRCCLIDSDNNLKYVVGHLHKFSDFMLQYQFKQIRNGLVELRVVTKSNYDLKKEKLILEDLKLKFGNTIQFTIVPVNEIIPDSSGKTSLVIYT